MTVDIRSGLADSGPARDGAPVPDDLDRTLVTDGGLESGIGNWSDECAERRVHRLRPSAQSGPMAPCRRAT